MPAQQRLGDDPPHSLRVARVGLVLGGARSGKSAEAERLVTRWAAGAAVTYVATSVLSDDDAGLAARVVAHRSRRPRHWATVDAGDHLSEVLRAVSGPVLLDSLGPWVAASFPDAPAAGSLVSALIERSGETVVVSDEVGWAVHPLSESGRWFVDALGLINQAVAAVAVDVRLVVAGRTLMLPPGEELDGQPVMDGPDINPDSESGQPGEAS